MQRLPACGRGERERLHDHGGYRGGDGRRGRGRGRTGEGDGRRGRETGIRGGDQGRRGGLAVLAGSLTTMSPSASSTRRMIFASSLTPAALALSCTCSGRLAPTIAADTFGFC